MTELCQISIRKCRFCAKEIQASSVICEHCGQNLIPGRKLPAAVIAPAAPIQIAAAAVPGTKRCQFCAEEILSAAMLCKHCGSDLVAGKASTRRTNTVVVAAPAKLSSGIAAVLSLVIPGAGQMYCGKVGGGLGWLLFVIFGYALYVVPGLILHIICIVAAASTAREVNALVATVDRSE